jgi:F-type H+-transporting ATPase subunit b
VPVLGVEGDPQAVVGPALAARGATFDDPVLPAGTHAPEALWNEVLAAEAELRTARDDLDDTVYVAGGGDIMGFDATLILVVVNFLGLLVLLYLLLWEPIMNLLDERAATIRDDLEGAAQKHAEANSLKGKYERVMLASKQERQGLIDEGRKEGEAERERIVGEAREEAEKIVARTREELEAAAEKVRGDLRREIGGLSVSLAERILAREVRPEDNQQLVDDFLAHLDEAEAR